MRITDNGPSGDTVASVATGLPGCDFATSGYTDAGFSGDLRVTDAQ